ncbi:AraC family transcriptional regulator [Nocardia aobensis]|uniref:AraC family transcriptional regulator n=1 Tax=Nocardia aobensis TaxID=257277 RepID=A0ABW6PFK7_9NOCA
MTDNAHVDDRGCTSRTVVIDRREAQTLPAGASRRRYVDALDSMYCSLAVDWPRVDPDFAVDISSRSVGDLTVSILRADAHKVLRTPAMAAADPTDNYLLALITRGTTLVHHNGHRSRVDPGSFVLFDPAAPFVVDASNEFEQIVVRTPRALLDSSMLATETTRVVGRAISSRSAIAGLVGRLLIDIAHIDRPLSFSASAVIASALMDLVATTVVESMGPLTGTARIHADDLVAVQRVMRRTAHDPAHTIADTAAEAGMSVRYVHKLFSDAGTTPQRWLYNLRLERSRTQLLDTEATVAEISRRVGFRDVSHFSRTFRNRFGVSPSVYRAAPDWGGEE